MTLKTRSESIQNEGRITLTIQAYKEGKVLLIRAVVRLYNCKIKTLHNYLQGHLSCTESTPNYSILSLTNKIILRDYILDTD